MTETEYKNQLLDMISLSPAQRGYTEAKNKYDMCCAQISAYSETLDWENHFDSAFDYAETYAKSRGRDAAERTLKSAEDNLISWARGIVSRLNVSKEQSAQIYKLFAALTFRPEIKEKVVALSMRLNAFENRVNE